jgi:small subunit ribosomal protein S11
MGKKRIIKQSGEEAIKEGKNLEANIARSGDSKKDAKKKYENGRVYIKSSYNNTFISITDDKGNLIAWSSAGSLGFSGPKKATPFAASKVVSVITEKTKKTGPKNIEIFVRGIGGGRDSAVRSLANQGFNIVSLKDVTPIPHNGPRAKKVRRV